MTTPTQPNAVIDIPIFKAQVGIFRTVKRTQEWFKANHMEPGSLEGSTIARSWHVEDASGTEWLLAYLPKFSKPGVVAHEMLHLANRLCETLGIGVTTENDELTAYLVEYLVDEHSKLKR